MKNFLPVALFLLFLLPAAVAQQNPGCNGTRFKSNVFASTTKTTVVYATATNYFGTTINLSMDVYQPVGDTLSARPAVILAHGGTFILGDKSQMQSYAELLARQGYVAVSIQYRLYPFLQLGYPDSTAIMGAAIKAMSDMKAAVRFLRLDAATTNDLRVDPNHIFIGGYSAGAVTALHAAYVDGDDDLPAFMQGILDANGGFEGNTGSTENQSYSSEVDGVVNMSGGLYRAHWVDENDVPLTSIHGTADQTVNYQAGLAANIAYLQGSAMIHARALAVGVPSVLETVTGGGHTDVYTATQFADELASFWVSATAMMEELSCAANVGVDENHAPAVEWTLAPNPAREALRLDWPAAPGAARVRVFDLQGRLQREFAAVQPGQTLPIGELPAGTYVVQVMHGEARFAAKLLIKN